MNTKNNLNRMYALLLAAAVLVGGSIWYACSADENDSEITFAEREAHSLNNARITTRLAQLETIKSTDLLELSNNRFVVAVSEKECDALDIDDSIYFEAQTMVEETNKLLEICECKAIQAGKTFRVVDCTKQSQNINYVLMKLTANAEVSMPGGSLSIWNAYTWASDTCFAPSSMVGITAHCVRHTNPLQTNFTHMVMAETTNEALALTLHDTNGNIIVPISESGCICYVSYLTNNSLGGECTWTGLNTLK